MHEYLELIDSLKQEKKSVFLRGNALDITFQTYIKNFDEKNIFLKNKVPPQHITKFCQSDSFSLKANSITISTNNLTSGGELIIFPADKFQDLSETRSKKRVNIKDDDQNTYCEFINPYDQVTLIKKSILDISDGGISIRSDHQSKLLSEGQVLKDIKIYLHKKIYKKTNGQIVHKQKYIDLNGKLKFQVGVKFI